MVIGESDSEDSDLDFVRLRYYREYSTKKKYKKSFYKIFLRSLSTKLRPIIESKMKIFKLLINYSSFKTA